MTKMIGHHAQAIQISRWAETSGASRPVRILAQRIINGQQDDIALMRQWLGERRRPVPHVDENGNVHAPSAGNEAHALHGAHHQMPGMLSETQLQRLREARGQDFDVLFLTYMIHHHRGAVEMVRELFATPGAGADEKVFRFASDVNVDQTTEIARMEKMLVELQPQ